MTDLSLFRVYEPEELGKDGYPLVWHSGLLPVEDLEDGEYVPDFDTHITFERAEDLVDPDPTKRHQVGVKHIVRMLAGHRCVRCGHPFTVGKSGVMEGPHAESRAFAAELGMTQEQLDYAFEDHVEMISEADIAKAPRTNWSPCDEQCTHGGPVRTRSPGAEWIEVDGTNAVDDLVTSGMEVQAAWRILTVHHLNWNKADLRWWNLIPTCQRCHLYLQRVVVMERVYPFEHDDYFKPYAAGWYASIYLQEELTREQTMGRLDELLALERMA